MPAGQLAEYANGVITLDVNADGAGWFIDTTPADDREFAGRGGVLVARGGSAAAGQVDLLSVLSHEMGHAIGLGHGGGVMSEQLLAGQRATPERSLALPGFNFDAVAQPRAAAMPAELPAIDWALEDGLLRKRQTPAVSAAWQERFVNQLGLSAERVNPNAALQLRLPSASGLAAKLVRL